MLERGEFACLPEVLLDYRMHGNNTTVTRWREQIAQADRARRAFLERELPPGIVTELDPVLRALAGAQDVQAAAVFAGLRQMPAHDLAAMPGEHGFLSRQTAQLAHQALRRSGRVQQQVALDYLRHGSDMLLPLAWRAVEARRHPRM